MPPSSAFPDSRARGGRSAAGVVEALRSIWRYRAILIATTRAEIEKKYAGSYLGLLWAVLYPACFLAMYSFLYLVVLQIRLPEFSQFGFVLFVFSGLVPYLAFSEVATTSTVVIKQNIHLIKNVMLPIDLVPVRIVAIALVSEAISLALLIALLLVSGELSVNVPLIVAAVAIQTAFLLGLAWLFAALGVLLPDLGNFVGLLTLFLLFVSPIGYKPEMVPAHAQWVLHVNPMAYMIDIVRSALLTNYAVPPWRWLAAALIAGATFLAGLTFFRRFKTFIVDYE
jgi:lipopolysaccharide transport system permease protein